VVDRQTAFRGLIGGIWYNEYLNGFMATRVLLVEDEPLLISLYTLALSRDGYDVRGAADLTSAEKYVVMERPHVVLLDLMIPVNAGRNATLGDFHEPTGFRILRLVRSNPALNGTRVIVLSNLDADEHIRGAKSLGADDYIVKSDLDPHALGQRITDVLHRPTQLG